MQTVRLIRDDLHKLVRDFYSVKKLDGAVVDEGFAFWVGGVSAEKPDQVAEFLNLARQGRIAEMAEQGQIAQELVYAILIPRGGGDAGYGLFVLTQWSDPLRQQTCLFSRVINDIEIFDGRPVHIPQSVSEARILPSPLGSFVSLAILVAVTFAGSMYAIPRSWAWVSAHLPGFMQTQRCEQAFIWISTVSGALLCIALWKGLLQWRLRRYSRDWPGGNGATGGTG